MNQALWVAKTGLDAQQTRMSVVSNNLANTNTTGFKRDRASFEDLLYQQVRQPGGSTSSQTQLPSGLQLGTGVRVVSTSKDFQQGNPQQTGRSLDVMVNGKLIARGTAEQVIAQTHLVTFNGEGAGIDRLAAEISRLPGVEMAAPFGQSLHVSGTDRAALEAALAPYRREPYRWNEVEPSLEDVFIRLMETSEDNFR